MPRNNPTHSHGKKGGWEIVPSQPTLRREQEDPAQNGRPIYRRLDVTLIIKYLFALGFAAGMIVFFATLLAGWKLAYPEIGNSSADNSNNSNVPL